MPTSTILIVGGSWLILLALTIWRFRSGGRDEDAAQAGARSRSAGPGAAGREGDND